jgi:hypothetical protein
MACSVVIRRYALIRLARARVSCVSTRRYDGQQLGACRTQNGEIDDLQYGYAGLSDGLHLCVDKLLCTECCLLY